jgi:radical SAM superfamily enzyme YgiQ (UPF0313 family)
LIVENYRIKECNGKNALLINPPIHDTQYWGHWSQPAGLLRIGSLLKEKGYSTMLIDCRQPIKGMRVPKKRIGIKDVGDMKLYWNHFGMKYEDFEEKLKGLVFKKVNEIYITSSMTYWWESIRDTINILREHFPSSKILLGGIYPTLCPEHAEKNVGADIVVKGEIYEASDMWTDISLYEKTPEYAIITSSRGCPFDCSYCAQKQLNGENIRCRNPTDVVDEIEDKVKCFGIKEFAFYEDNLLINGNHFEGILDLIIEKDLHINLYAPEGMNPSLLSQKILGKMKEAGFKKIHLGFESISEEMKKKWNRFHETLEQFESALKMCERAGFKLRTPEINAFVLYGVPGEKIEDIASTILYVSHKVGSIIPMLFTPVPGSKIYEEYKWYIQEKKLSLEDLNGKLFPFAEYNGCKVSDYMDLLRLMFTLNSLARGKSFDLLADSLVSNTVRQEIVKYEERDKIGG